MKCGEQLPDDANFCRECGVPQRARVAAVEPLDSYDQQPGESHDAWVARLSREAFEATAPPDHRPAWKALLAPLRLFQWEYEQISRHSRPAQAKQPKADKR